MRRILSLATPFFLALASTVLADIEFAVPTAGTIFRAGDAATAIWKDSGKPPRISELVQYDLFLCAGGDEPGYHEEVALLTKDAVFAQNNSVSFTIDPEVGGNGENAYFLKMLASGPDAFVVNYSDRFTLTGMTGSFAPNIIEGIPSRPHRNDDFNPIMENEYNERRRAVVDPYTIPYSLQTGPTKYAPMAKKPGTAIPTTSPEPQYPTSPYKIATAYLGPATVKTTLTATETHTLLMVENPAAPAPLPADSAMK